MKQSAVVVVAALMVFGLVGTSGPAASQIAAAKAVCQRCDVRLACLEWAMATGQDAGVWGGLSEEERRALRRARQRGEPSRLVAVVYAAGS